MNTTPAHLAADFLLSVAQQIIEEHGLQDEISAEELISEDDPALMRDLVVEAARQRAEREASEREIAKQARLEAVRCKLQKQLGLVQESEPAVDLLQESSPSGPTEDQAVVVFRPPSSASKPAADHPRIIYPSLPDVCFIQRFATENAMAIRGILIVEYRRLGQEHELLVSLSDPRHHDVYDLRGRLGDVLDQLQVYLEHDLGVDVRNRSNFASKDTFDAMRTEAIRDDRTEKFFRTFVAKETNDASSYDTNAHSAANSSGSRAAADARKRQRAAEDRAFRQAAKGGAGGGGKNKGGKKK